MYLQPWWWDAVCGSDGWQAAVATDEGGEPIGVLPYVLKRRAGGIFRTIQPPPFTTYAGPFIAFPEQKGFKLNSQYSFEKRVVMQLLAQLPAAHYSVFQCAPAQQNGLPFHWAGFRQTVRYTYLLPPADNEAEVQKQFKGSVRTDLKIAAEKVEVIRDDTAAAAMFSLYQASLRRKGRTSGNLEERFLTLHSALQTRKQSACFLAKNRHTDQIAAGIYLAFDDRRAGLLLSGTHPDALDLRGIFPLMQEAIQFCSARGLILDFEGSMDEGLEHFFRSFGAHQQPYLRVWRTASRWMEAARWWWLGRD